ncbi:MAG: hypothetical protein ACOCQR_03300, partial [bacterium]
VQASAMPTSLILLYHNYGKITISRPRAILLHTSAKRSRELACSLFCQIFLKRILREKIEKLVYSWYNLFVEVKYLSVPVQLRLSDSGWISRVLNSQPSLNKKRKSPSFA